MDRLLIGEPMCGRVGLHLSPVASVQVAGGRPGPGRGRLRARATGHRTWRLLGGHVGGAGRGHVVLGFLGKAGNAAGWR